MSEERHVRVEVAGGIGRLILDRPHARNALHLHTAHQLVAAVDDLEKRCSVIVISGAGGFFSAGADLPYVRSTVGRPGATRQFLRALNDAFDRVEAADVPVIAEVEGFALAGGFELMQCCDFAVVADDARIGDQHANFGLLPGAGGSQRLPRLIGRQRALGLLLTGDWLDGPGAVAMGIAYRSVPRSELAGTVDQIAATIASHSETGLRLMKQLVRRSGELSVTKGIDLEIDTFCDYIGTADPHEGLAAFAEKRTPRFQGSSHAK
jgi:enoyl-CoA hydratase/carnithine racemase